MALVPDIGRRTLTNRIPLLALVLGVLAVSTASTFIRLAQREADSLSIAAWRLTLAAGTLAPFALTNCRDEWRKLNIRTLLLLIASGIMLAVHFYTWITSLALTSVAASVVFVATNPLFVALISHFILGERLTQTTLLGLMIAIAGSLLIGMGDAGEGTHQLAGDGLALAGAFAVAVYMLIGRRLRAELSLLAYIFPVYSTAAVVLMALALFWNKPITGFTPHTWLWLTLVALIPQVIGHSSFNWALGHLPTTYVALATLTEPIGSTLLAWAILQEKPTWGTAFGGILILFGVGLAIRKRHRVATAP